ncbi:SDR family NAD(P)-dependent oxidoreductase [Bradyrhizobium sp. TM233]|uniref:SDR family NAD(P)-dependent oxidoreductase n=1 Tax=Bradyrhizobium sp. TM233 TaxID=2599801 RepID=UPI0027D5EA7D|nr:SDR family oxidoreductase [Bradyrhizobium sp. TM233]
MNSHEVAVVVGAGPGLGNALVARFADAGMHVAAISRSGGAAEPHRELVRRYPCDATIAEQVKDVFARVRSELGAPSLVVFNVGIWDRGGILEISAALFEQAWRTGCFAGFLIGRAAAASMLDSSGGTIIFSGATGSIRGGGGFAAFASPKFALRALAQSMARELGPKNIHVAHVILDGMIAQDDDPSEALLQPAAIAESYYQLHRQARSAWTHELDLRPSSEKF